MKYYRDQMEEFDHAFYITGLCVIAFLIIYVILARGFGFTIAKKLPPCAFHRITGFYCPGCGGTRATYAFFQGKIVKSFILHPLVPYTGLLGIYFMLTQTLERITKKHYRFTLRFQGLYLWIALAIIVLNFVIRNAIFLVTGFTVL